MQRLRTMHLFAGAGGGILADLLLGHQPVCAVEINPYCQQVLAARQEDGCLPWFPIFADVTKFDGRPWHGIVDVVSGGFPCQDISAAGAGAGIDGERSGLWREMARIIGEVRPRFVFVENSPLLVGRGLVRVLADLAEMGFDVRWGVVGASDVGAPHRRDRCWVIAYATGEQHQGAPHAERRKASTELFPNTDSERGRPRTGRQNREEAGNSSKDLADTNGERQQELHSSALTDKARQHSGGFVARRGDGWWITEPDVGRKTDGMA